MTVRATRNKQTDHAQMLHWIARLGAVTAPALAEHEGCSQPSARGRLQAAVRAGLLVTGAPAPRVVPRCSRRRVPGW